MKKAICFALTVLFIATTGVYADVTIRVTDTNKRIMRVTYLWTDSKAGATKFEAGPLLFASTPIKVISVIEKNTEQDLEAKIFQKDGKQWLLVEYPNPVPKGGNYKLDVTIEAETEWISKDSKGKHVFTYKTGHVAFFVLPKGHAVVYSNYPVLVYERRGNTVLQVKESGTKELIFKTMAFSTD